MNTKKAKNKKAGSMMIEIIVATSIITLAALAFSVVETKAISLSRQATHLTQVAFLLEEGAESVKIFRDNNTWTNFATLFIPSSTYCLTGTVSSWTSALPTSSPCTKVGIFNRTINVANVNRDATTGNIVSSGGVLDTNTKFFTVTVTWDEKGISLTKTLRFYINNIFS